MTLDEVQVNLTDLPSFSPPPEVAALLKDQAAGTADTLNEAKSK